MSIKNRVYYNILLIFNKIKVNLLSEVIFKKLEPIEKGCKMKKVISLFLLFIFCSVVFTGCSFSKKYNTLKSDKIINIAVLGSEKDDIADRKDFFAGVKLAVDELKSKGITVNYTVFNDNGSFDTGVSNAKKIAEDDNYMIAFTLQSFETVDTVAKIFEDAKKPLIVVDGCYDETMEKDYKYVLNLTLSAEDQGKALGEYAKSNGGKNVALLHSNSNYNLDFIEGFNDPFDESNTSKVVDIVGNLKPSTKTVKFDEIINRWQILEVDTVVLSYEDMDFAVELVKSIREIMPEVKIFTDSYFNNLSYMDKYSEYLEGIVMPSSYPVDSNDRLQKFYTENESKVSDIDITSISAQGYDIIKMIVNKSENINTALEFMDAMKSKEGYEGVTGIKFTKNGLLNKDAKYWIIKDEIVYRMEAIF